MAALCGRVEHDAAVRVFLRVAHRLAAQNGEILPVQVELLGGKGFVQRVGVVVGAQHTHALPPHMLGKRGVAHLLDIGQDGKKELRGLHVQHTQASGSCHWESVLRNGTF